MELQEHICSFCEPSLLATLSLAHTTCTEPAEVQLYRGICIRQYSEADKSFQLCARTLKENQKKAQLVHSLLVDLVGSDSEYITRRVGALVAALKFTVNLRFLSLFLKTDQGDDRHILPLEEVLKWVHRSYVTWPGELIGLILGREGYFSLAVYTSTTSQIMER